jgi:hypothetical protein
MSLVPRWVASNPLQSFSVVRFYCENGVAGEDAAIGGMAGVKLEDRQNIVPVA